MVAVCASSGSRAGISPSKGPFGCLRPDQQSYDHVRWVPGKLWGGSKRRLGADQRERAWRTSNVVETLPERRTATTERQPRSGLRLYIQQDDRLWRAEWL